MQATDILYDFEHNVLPGGFFEYGSGFVGSLLQKREKMLFGVLGDMFQNAGLDNPYSEVDFGLEVLEADEELVVIKILYPKPERTPLCYCGYLFVDKDFQKMRFFCLERDDFMGKEDKILCEWTAKMEHFNYGACASEEQEDYKKCMEIYLNE